MGRSHRTLFFLILPFLLLTGTSLSADNLSGISAELTDFALPVYQKDGSRMLFIIYGKKAVNLGAYINLNEPLTDILKGEISNVSELDAVDRSLLYGLNADRKQVEAFWKTRPHTEAVIYGPAAECHKGERTLRGEGEVHFRSPAMDLDGIGFDAFLRRKFIHIRSRVRAVIRPEVRQWETTGKEKTSKHGNKVQKK